MCTGVDTDALRYISFDIFDLLLLMLMRGGSRGPEACTSSSKLARKNKTIPLMVMMMMSSILFKTFSFQVSIYLNIYLRNGLYRNQLRFYRN